MTSVERVRVRNEFKIQVAPSGKTKARGHEPHALPRLKTRCVMSSLPIQSMSVRRPRASRAPASRNAVTLRTPTRLFASSAIRACLAPCLVLLVCSSAASASATRPACPRGTGAGAAGGCPHPSSVSAAFVLFSEMMTMRTRGSSGLSAHGQAWAQADPQTRLRKSMGACSARRSKGASCSMDMQERVAVMNGEFVLRRGSLDDLQALTDLSVQVCKLFMSAA